MIFGNPIQPIQLALGGSFLFVLFLFQFLQGMRKIKFKGALHLKVHKRMAWVLMAAAVFHGFIGMAYTFAWRIG